MSWFEKAGGFNWLRTVPGTPDPRNGYDRLERLYKINKDPGRFSYEALISALDRGTSRSWRNSPAGQDYVNSWLARRQSATAPAPAPAPAPPPAPAAAPQATLKVQAPTTPQVSTSQSANQVAELQRALAQATASFQSQMGQQTQSYQKQLADYQAQAQQQFQTFQQQSQAQLAAAQQQAEESQRQMMIGLAQRDRAPAEVKMAQSGAAQQGLTRRGTTGYFGRQGMRIGSLNVPTSGLTISTDAAGRAASGSFM